MELKKYELRLSEGSMLVIKSRKTKYCEEWCNVFLVEKSKLVSETDSYNSVYLGDESKEKIIQKLEDADNKRNSKKSSKCTNINGIDHFSVITFLVCYSTLYLSAFPENILTIIYGHPSDLLGTIKIQFCYSDFSEWIRILSNA